MVVTLIIACEVGFWVLLVAGLALRYLARMPKTGAAVLLLEPLLELALLIVTAVDLKNGAAADWKHGLAALYIGYTVAYGHYTIKWFDGHFAHRFAGGPRPAKRYGMARFVHELKLWVRTVVMAAVGSALLQGAIWYVGKDGDTSSLRQWQGMSLKIVMIHGVIALTYLIWQKKDPGGRTAPDEAPARPAEKSLR
ncbi:hypothetical protein ADL22_25135 [Streptomyces sp. NRRL F-4489]|uniref:hypothetical protein n=1 Tax=Streptomyces sp. NRRL F-4489 TaxID=1609095 RepID=UPI00074A4BC7|nr:hypothetical protein [Streptomyces sp. NRRL F-4489]KUL36276.1 hypothetical protein ADL22_25135 [Streptomyces sp. NRRL F-4489]